MNMNHSKKQRGVVVVAVAIALPVLLLIMGMALDFGHVFVNKTRLQNALDATALSAAIAVNRDVTHNTTDANIAGRATFDRFKTASGNNELAGLNAGSLVFDYSRTLQPFSPGTTPPAFVRVTSTNMLNVTPVLIRILDQFSGDMPIPAIATAGPVGQNCNLVPLVICPKAGAPIGCDATGCNGIPFHTKVCLKGGTNAAKQDTCQDSSLPSGNFGLLRFEGFAGAKDIEDLLAGTVNTCANTATWEPGNKVGKVSSGIKARFEADLVKTEYKGVFPDGGYNPQYVADTNKELAKIPIPAGTAYNRVMAVPVVEDCNALPIKIIAASCFLLTEQAKQHGGSNEIIGELTDSCPGPGAFSPTNPVLFGPYKIVLFKSPGSGDS
ncbi:MAG: pilus assembly protein TadG-related protein [Methylobacter sp.]|nr:pilus assembly protein TadG-related protein [Methylobacter sp.]